MRVKEYLQNNILIFDGAMGTYYAALMNDMSSNCEAANIDNPRLILDIHKEYIEAGARAIRTNTFGLDITNLGGDRKRQKELIKAGYEIAVKAAEDKAFVFADIGPIMAGEHNEKVEEYINIVSTFLELGANNFIFETHSSDIAMVEVARYIKKECKEAFVMVDYACHADGYTREGYSYKSLLEKVANSDVIDATGLNCICSASHMYKLLREINIENIPLAAMPNIGYPIVRGNRTYYGGSKEYFAEQMKQILEIGVRIVGACCGSDPEYIKIIKGIVDTVGQPVKKKIVYTHKKDFSELKNVFWDKVNSGKKVIAVELDSPKDFNTEDFVKSSIRLKKAGADIITIADCPIARPRLDSCMLAAKLKREHSIEAMPHMTCRDRNINATKALLLGVRAENISNVLTVTGDPIPNAERTEVAAVYQLNSRKLAAYIDSLNKEVFNNSIKVYAALNVNARKFDSELKRAMTKISSGVVGFLTQPVLTDEALQNLKTAREKLDAKILGGILPIISDKNALFIQNEVNGINVPEDMIRLYEGKSRDEAEKLAYDISVDIAKRMSEYVDGYYLITPFTRIDLMLRIINYIKYI